MGEAAIRLRVGERSLELVGINLNQWGILFHALPFFKMNRFGNATDLRLDLNRLVGAHGADERQRLGNRGAFRFDGNDLSGHSGRRAFGRLGFAVAAAERREESDGGEQKWQSLCERAKHGDGQRGNNARLESDVRIINAIN